MLALSSSADDDTDCTLFDTCSAPVDTDPACTDVSSAAALSC